MTSSDEPVADLRRAPTRRASGGQSTSARRGEIAYQTIPSPSIGVAGGPQLELRQVREVGDADGRACASSPGIETGTSQPSRSSNVAPSVALRALHRRCRDRVDVAAVGGGVDREEGESAHDFTFSPAGS